MLPQKGFERKKKEGFLQMGNKLHELVIISTLDLKK
jgi:hypothetical protein